MNKMKISPPAYPTYLADNMAHGMTLRDYFAAAAMPLFFDNEDSITENNLMWVAKFAYELADQMMQAREE